MKRRIFKAWAVLWIILAFCLSSGYALKRPAHTDEGSIAGHWEGAIELPGTKLEFNIDFAAKPDGSLSGDISIPAQNAKDLPLDKIIVSGKDVSFEIMGIPGAPSFAGALNEDGLKISGNSLSPARVFRSP